MPKNKATAAASVPGAVAITADEAVADLTARTQEESAKLRAVFESLTLCQTQLGDLIKQIPAGPAKECLENVYTNFDELVIDVEGLDRIIDQLHSVDFS